MEAASFAGALSWAISNMSSDHIRKQLRQVGASDEQLQTMAERFLSIQKSVELVHNRKGGTADNALQDTRLYHWLEKVDDLTFYVEDTINEYLSEDARRKDRSFKKSSFFSPPCRMSRRVRSILSRLEDLLKESSRLGISILSEAQSPPTDHIQIENRTTDQVSRPTIPKFFVGRDTVENTIIDDLRSRSRRGGENDIFTIAIYGIAGIGKTALVSRVYMNETIKELFEKRFWVAVGEVFEATRIMKQMLQSITEKTVDLSEYEAIKLSLRDEMRGENTLIVLDDVWSVNPEQLSKLYALQSGVGRISILVTTRRIEAARSIADSQMHQLLPLEESWSLFKTVANDARSSQIEEGSELELACKRIAEKCYGVPQVICKMAGSLANVDNVKEWEKKVESELWEFIMSALSLKFSSLPKAVRRCFAYCSIFPKNATFRKLDLLRLWLAQGFVSEEATAEVFFNILLNQSLLQVCEQDEDGQVQTCTMDDFAYDLAVNFSIHDHMLEIARENQENLPNSLSDVRHLVISSTIDNLNVALRVKNRAPVRRLRTIYVKVGEVPENLLSQARSLYVLKLDGLGLKEVPRNLDKLKYLRYLDLSNNPITCLPESITHLHSLQTLLLKDCEQLSTLSECQKIFINRLTLVELPPQLYSKTGASHALRILPPINLKAEGGLKLSDLGGRDDVAGLLCINGLEHVTDIEGAQKARIGCKLKLSSLELCWDRSKRVNGNDAKVLDALQPHPNIKRLKLINYDSQQFPKWVMKPMKGDNNERLYSLVKIELVNCKRCLILPSMGDLPCLRELIIDGMDNVESIGHELYYHADDSEVRDILDVFFPVLTRLVLRNFSKLREWKPPPTMIRAFPRLETLQVVNCPDLIRIPDFPRIKHLLIQGVRGVNIKGYSWLDTVIKNSSSSLTLNSLVLCKVSGLDCLPWQLFQCTSLERLWLQKCEDLNSWPIISWNLISLKELCIDGCSSLNSSPDARSLTALNSLVIRGCRTLKAAPTNLNMCTSLSRVAISNCSKLTTFQDLNLLSSLKELDILDCESLESLPPVLDSLTSLRTLRIGGAKGMFQNFPECTSLQSLETVWLKGREFLDFVPQQLRRLPQLKVLRIRNFTLLESLPDWICDDLTNLEILILEDCRTLCKLPSQQKLMQLRKLRNLRIENCRKLWSFYNNENGSMWTDICHVPHIKFDACWLQRDRTSFFQDQDIHVRPRDAEQEDQLHDTYNDITYPISNDERFSFNVYVAAFCVLNLVLCCLLISWVIIKNS